MSSMTTYGEFFLDTVLKTQLFLEAALSAPYGQFVKFELTDEGTKAIYKEESQELSEELKRVQEGILIFAKKMDRMMREIDEEAPEALMKMAKDIYHVLLNEQGLFGKICKTFTVNDDYSGYGDWLFDAEENTWTFQGAKND